VAAPYLTISNVTFQNNGALNIPGNSITIGDAGILEHNGDLFLNNLTIKSGSVLTRKAGQRLSLTIADYLTIEAGGSINVDGKGESDSGQGMSSGRGGGAGYGGEGGATTIYGGTVSGGPAYGSLTKPTELGSVGGSGWASGGSGGGAIFLNVCGTLTVDGTISANGSRGVDAWHYGGDTRGGGGGSGGSIYVTANALVGTGTISANGGDGGCGAGGGGGGRIAIHYNTNSFTGVVSAYGGSGFQSGGAGTIYRKSSSQINGSLLVDSNAAGADTPITGTFDDLTIRGNSSSKQTGVLTVSNFILKSGNAVVKQQDALSLSVSNFTVEAGTLSLQQAGTITISNLLASLPSSTISISGNLLGDTRNADQYGPQGSILLNGSGTAISPQLLEAMGRDFGANAAGFTRNFVYQTLALGNNTYVRLVDQAENAAGVESESVYVNSLAVPAGTTLDLNGLRLYTRLAQINGAVTGGTVMQIPDSGPIDLDSPTPGSISYLGNLDEWTFFGRAGQWVTIVANPGGSASPAAPPPLVGWIQIQLVDSATYLLATKTNSSLGQVVTLTDVVLPADGLYRVVINAPPGQSSSTGNYIVTVWDVTPDVVGSFMLNEQFTGQVDTPYSTDRWPFYGVAGQQVRLNLLNTSTASIVFDLTGPEGWVGFSGITGSSGLITLPSSGVYTLTAHVTGGQYGGAYSFRLQETTQTNLTLGVTYQGTLAASGQAQIFVVKVPSSMPMKVVLNDSSTANYNELYVKFGDPPTRSDYDYRFSNPSAANQQVFVPMATAGTWYVLVYGDYVPTQSTYTLLATASSIILNRVTPDRLANNANMTLTLTGAGFDSTTTAQLVSSAGTTYAAVLTQVDSFTQIASVFAANIVPPGRYSVRVSRAAGDSAQLDNAFETLPSGKATLETNLIVPSTLGYSATGTIWVEYRNTGTMAMPAPLLVLTATQNGREGGFLTLQKVGLTEGFWTSATPEGFSHSVQILASGAIPGVLLPGEFYRVPVYYAGWEKPWDMSYPPFNFNLGVLKADDSSTADWASLKDSMRPITISTQAWDALWAKFAAQVGTTWGGYVRMLDDNAAYLGRLGQKVVDVGQLLAFEFLQANGLNPLRSLAGAVDAAVEAPGLPLAFTRFFAEPISQRFEQGPLGRGWSHNWQLSLQKDADGTVTVLGPGGSRRTFKPDRRTSNYFSQPGDYATLTANAGGAFTLQEKSGLLYAFRPDGKFDYVQDTNGNRITGGYTGTQLTSLTHSSGQSLQITYNAAGRIQSLMDHIGRETLFTYDGAGEHLLGAQYHDGRTATYNYNIASGATQHALTEVDNSCCNRRYFAYDAQGRLIGTYLAGNAEAVTFAYDSTGKTTVTDALGGASKFYFDHRGLLVKTEDALGNAVHMEFDDYYNLVAMTDPAGRSYNYTYDTRGNITRSMDALGNITRFSYTGPFIRLSQVTDAKSNVTGYAYDAKGNLQSITYADGSRESWSYNATGEPTTWENRRDRAIDYSYDSAGRIASKTYVDGSHIDYNYDVRGNLVQAVDPTGTTALQYDAKDQLTKITYPGGLWLQFTYDAGGRRASSVDQLGHRLDYSYDAVGHLETIGNETGVGVVAYTYDAAGRLSRKTLGNGIYTTYEYDAAGQVLHLVNYKSDSTVLSLFDYTYDSRGRRTSMATLDGTWTYEYDDIGQLTHAVLAPANPAVIHNQDLRYEYDALGNRIRTIENGVTTAYTTNNMNQYTQVGNTTYTFDADGNLIQETSPAETTTYTYNDENRLVAVTAGTNTWQYTYDAFGSRVAATENGITTRHIVDPIGLGNLVGEYNASDMPIANYDYGRGLLRRSDPTGNSGYYTFDANGNVDLVIAANANIMNTYEFAPFGTVIRKVEGIKNVFCYAGEFGLEASASNLIFARNRYILGNLGRFTSVDTIQNPSSNPYHYVTNSPLNWIDPNGLAQQPGPPFCLGVGRDCANTSWNEFPWWWKYNPLFYWDWAARIHDIEMEQQRQKFNGDKNYWYHGKDLSDWIPDLPIHGYLAYNLVGPFLGRPVPFLIKLFFINALTEPVSTAQSSNPRPVDPNAKTGPVGVGSDCYVPADGTLAYQIYFENEPSATAPAQQVTITDQLSTNLDQSTFELTEIGFGDKLIAVPPNTPYYESVVPMSYNGVNFEVWIYAGINATTGKVSAQFYSIDPSTELPPNVLIGFLPPENGTGRGMGHISYTIRPKPGLTTGTQIRNVAQISFDQGEIVATNQRDPHNPAVGTDPAKEALNTIDAGAPTSHVDPLPPTVELTFSVTWQGTDDQNGSGVWDYTIYRSDNGGSFIPWLANTTGTSAVFSGIAGHTYSFFSIARDLTGNVEAAKTVAEATTRVWADSTPPITTATASPGPNANGWNKDNVAVNMSATDNADGSGVKQISYSLNGQPPTVVTGATASVTISQEGTTTLAYSATDNEGNQEAAKTLTIRIDKTPPIVTYSSSPNPNAKGWNKTNVTVIFNATDTLSGIDVTPGPAEVTTEGANQPITRSATDKAGNSAGATCRLSIDKTPPAITAPANVTAYTGPAAASCSTELSDAALGSPTASDSYGPVTLSRLPAGNVFPVGTTSVTWTATDSAGNTASAAQTVAVIDNTPPTISKLTATPNVLWPPNHKMVPVTVAAIASDNCGPAPTTKIISVSSNEPVNGLGDGDKEPDWEVTGNLTLNLRAERSGTGNGRTYTITVQATDASGNNSTKTVTVSVPKDNG
jgi:RHS repeat-associated protein